MKKSGLLLLAFFTCFSIVNGQQLQRQIIDVFQDGVQLVNPLTGGLKAPQFSEVDLNGDGIMDLFIFDKTGNVKLTFINKGTPNKVDYVYAPFYSRSFPELADWALLRDFDKDGMMDIFTEYPNQGISGVVVYKGRFENNRLVFDRFNFPQLSQNIIPIPTGGGLFTQLYISQEDIPAIDDINGDGDLDILTFSDAGGVVYLYENQSMEMGYGTDSLIYRRTDDCWGRFFETGISNCLKLSDDPDECVDCFNFNTLLHPGSTLLTFDNDGDGDKEVLIGDISFPTLVLAINNGDENNAWITDQDCAFPSYDNSLNIVNFPSSFYIDVDNDGLKDLIAASNTDNIGVSFKSIWWYKNTNANDSPIFELESRDFMISDMLQFGLGANPTFVDYNADGLLDIVVGNLRFNSDDISNLFLLENIGNASQPAYRVVDEDYLGFKDLFATSDVNFDFTPTFGDLDNDGDEDLLVGDNSGQLFYAENIAGPGKTFQFSPLQGSYMGIDVGQKSTPQIIDMDRDGLPDLVVGEKTVNFVDMEPDKISSFNFFKNVGTADEAMFNAAPDATGNNQFFGRVSTLVTGPFSSNAGESAPAIYDFETDFLFFTGSSSGNIMVYDQLEGNLNGAFHEVDRDYGSLDIGVVSRIDIADINADGFLDLMVGNKRGGINIFTTTYRTDGKVATNDPKASNIAFNLFPNPASTTIQLEWSSEKSQEAGQVLIYDALGRQMKQAPLDYGHTSLEVSNWPEGIYFAELKVGTQRVVKKFVVRR